MPVKRKVAQFGSWSSPVSAALVARASRRVGGVQSVGGDIYWSESRPEEQGRQVIVRTGPDGRAEDVLAPPYSARSRVHEYGGGEFLATGAAIYFVNDRDQQVYLLGEDGSIARITDEKRMRFADPAFDRERRRLIAVAERHRETKAGEAHPMPDNLLVSISLGETRGTVETIASGRDFYASPRLSADGGALAFLAWDLPDMPWDGAALFLAQADKRGGFAQPKRIAGGKGTSVFQPEWGPDGHLYFTWDKSGWGSLYRWSGHRAERVLGLAGAELWRAQWVFGARCFALHQDGRLAASFMMDGAPNLQLARLGSGGKVSAVPIVRSDASRIDDPVASGDGFIALASLPLSAPAIVRIGRDGVEPVTKLAPPILEADAISRGEVIEFRNAKRQRVFAIHYPPVNPRFSGLPGTAPPALILAHGGPTSMSDASFKPRVQFYTSRGFAVCDVNYGGSTGFGRAYRERLDGEWGVADVADCAAAAKHLAREGLADAEKIAIAGGSAGGYTTLMALATSDAFAAGASHYGISDLGLLLAHTHKFESGYLHRLLGTTPKKWKERFAERSPLNLIEGITAPVILFQGLDDKVVPPEQSRLIVEKLKERGVEVGYHEFAGEGHGFRKAETIIAVLEAELAFLKRVMKIGVEAPLSGRRRRQG
jgi:dipeptidyl aminopeptidase/acylaminoacyl peptidase